MQACQYVFHRSHQRAGRYGAYVAEILGVEGFTGFSLVDLDESALPDLQDTDLLVLARCLLEEAEIEALVSAVERGARLVVFQPSARLAARLGWECGNRVIHPGWIRVRPGFPGAGLPLQTHVPVTVFNAAASNTSWEPVADAVTNEWGDAGCPAVVRQGLRSGSVAVCFYDLPAAVASIRFGNPDLAGYATTGQWNWTHAGDLFAGHLDERARHLPQADFHAQLLAKLLTSMAPYPLARWWYYPEASQRSIAVFQSDDDWSTIAQFDELAGCLQSYGGRGTFYLVADTKMTAAKVESFRARGHTFAPHINPRTCRDEWHFDFPRAVRAETAAFRERWGACSATLQCHCAPWQGYMDWVPLFREEGYRLLFAYLSLSMENWLTFMCGSGRPIRFCDQTGTIHDSWQQPVVVYDDASLIDLIRNQSESLLGRFDALLDETLNRTHTALPFLSHPVSFATYSRAFMESCFARMHRAGMPILNGDQWLEFTDRRSSAAVQTIVSGRDAVRYRVAPFEGLLTLMVPVTDTALAGPAVRVNGAPAGAPVVRRLEENYACVALEGAGRTIDVDVRR